MLCIELSWEMEAEERREYFHFCPKFSSDLAGVCFPRDGSLLLRDVLFHSCVEEEHHQGLVGGHRTGEDGWVLLHATRGWQTRDLNQTWETPSASEVCCSEGTPCR